MKSFRLLITLTLLIFFNQFSNGQNSPNVVLFLVDDLGWTDLSCFGSDFYKTPNIDKLASEGIRFTNSYSTCTVCSPTRASVMTGKYPARLHLTDWIKGYKYPWAKLSIPDWTMYLDSTEYTMAEAFKDAGYKTAHFGKWHLGEKKENWPEYHGFDLNIAGYQAGAPQLKKKQGLNGYFPPYGNPRLDDGPAGEYLTERLANEVCNYIEENTGTPFFINFWFYNVHTPLQAKQDKIDKYAAAVNSTNRHKNPTYAAMVEHTDEAIGKVIAKLKEKGLIDNTIILFSSDNGGLTGNKGNITNNFPLRHGKGNMYEGGVRVPTILFSPFLKEKGVEVDELVNSNDYFPTLIDLAGINSKTSMPPNLDGKSWLPLLKGTGRFKREEIFWHYPHYHKQGAVPYSAVRSGKWKLIENFETNQVKLYNLAEDIGEQNNIAGEFPKVAKRMKKKLQNWRTDVNAQYPSQNSDYKPGRADEIKW